MYKDEAMFETEAGSGGGGVAADVSPDREMLTSIYADMLSHVGLTGREIARLSGTRPQYISDIKRRQRPLSQDMFMRTLLGLYGEYKWLISGNLLLDTERIKALYPFISEPDSDMAPLPVFQKPFMGPNMTAEDWDGSFFCVTNPIKELARRMRNPYVLHLPFDDKSGRLRRGDYLLVNQTESADAKYLLLKSGWGVKLARRTEGGYEDIESGESRPGAEAQIIGNVTMILCGEL